MSSFYVVALYSKRESYYYNNLALAKQEMINKGYAEGDVIYLMRLNVKGEYEIVEEHSLHGY